MSPHWPSLLHPALCLAQEALRISVRYTGRPHTDWPISLAGAATSIIFVATKIRVCRDKHNFVATKPLSEQAYLCRDKHVLVATNICGGKHTFVATEKRVLSRKTGVCGDKHLLVATTFVAKKSYLWQLPPMIGQGPDGPSDPCIIQARQCVALLQ